MGYKQKHVLNINFAFWKDLTYIDLPCVWVVISCNPRGGGGGTPFDDLYGEAPPQRGTILKLQVHESVGISLVEVYKMVGKSVIWVRERAQKD